MTIRILSNQTDNPKQLSLPIESVPKKVRAHGLREIHVYPRVSVGEDRATGTHGPVFRVPVEQAFDYSRIELRTPNSHTAIQLDIDGYELLMAAYLLIDNGEAPVYNWLAPSGGGGAHLVYTLAHPVLYGEGMRQKPLNALARVSEYLTSLFGGDPSYNGILTVNPMSRAHPTGFKCAWGRRGPYTLDELAQIIPFGWRKPVVSCTAIGRNVSLFDALRRWAGKEENKENDVLAAAMSINREVGKMHGKIPLDQSEVATIARSVHRKRAEWIRRGKYYTQEEKTLWGRTRQKKGVEMRRKKNRERDLSIIQAVSDGESASAIGRRFKVHHTTILRIITRELAGHYAS